MLNPYPSVSLFLRSYSVIHVVEIRLCSFFPPQKRMNEATVRDVMDIKGVRFMSATASRTFLPLLRYDVLTNFLASTSRLRLLFLTLSKRR